MQFLKGGVPLDGEKRETGALVVNLRRRRGLEKWALGCCPANGARAFRGRAGPTSTLATFKTWLRFFANFQYTVILGRKSGERRSYDNEQTGPAARNHRILLEAPCFVPHDAGVQGSLSQARACDKDAPDNGRERQETCRDRLFQHENHKYQ
jgi:hypothetical protein